MKLFTFLLLCSFPLVLFAQEVITPLDTNKAVWNAYRSLENHQSPRLKRNFPRSLPFFDDFSTVKVYPGKNRWIDRSVYINNGFAVEPPSIGVATFDGLDQRGFPYNTDGRNLPRYCDTLTSRPIDLSGLSEEDSVYLSFYLQQKGLGDNPESNDSFFVEFRRDSISEWEQVWAKGGEFDSFQIFPFKQYFLKVPARPNNGFFHDSFQFRFRNYGNRTGALDHWHLDYIVLDEQRSMMDTVVEDICLHRPPKGLFSRYFSIPYRHFRENRANEITEEIDYQVFNKSLSTQSPDIEYRIYDVSNDRELYNSATLSQQILDIPSYSRRSAAQDNELPSLYFDQLNDKHVIMELRLRVTSSNIVGQFDLLDSNDVYRMYQYFDEYFAYDDGTAEGGYGLQNTRNGRVAIKFSASVADSLRYIAFNFTGGFEPLPDRQKFNIVIWDQIIPEEVEKARIAGVSPVYSDYINGFALYKLDKPIVVAGDFYVGWEQFRRFNLNVGIDLDYRFFNDGEPNPNLYFNTAGAWEQSSVVGTPLIRPVFAQDAQLGLSKLKKHLPLQVYPNPADNAWNVQLDEDASYSIFNMQGQNLESGKLSAGTNSISCNNWDSGVYFLQVRNERGTSRKKILKY